MSQTPDYSKVSPELQAKIAEWEKNNPQNKQLTVLGDIADMLQNFLETYDDDKKEDSQEDKQLHAVILDIRETLQEIAGKEDKEMPDFAAPIVKALEKLEKKDYSPTIKVDAPRVTVPTPVANVTVDAPRVDTKGIESVIKKELSTAFKEAISLIPSVEIPEPINRWDDVIEWLQSIDTASRMKPQFPTTLKVINPDGTSVSDVNLKQQNTILFTPVSASGSGDNQVVAGVTSKKIKVLSALLVSNGTVSVKWRSNTTDKSGSMPLVVNSGFVLPASSPGQGHYFETAAGEALNINLSGAVAVSGHISYYTEA